MRFLLLIRVQRIYDNPKGRNNNDNDFRILVDRLWPRGLSKDKVKVDLWKKDIAPSNLLRKWFNHDEKKWNEFKRNYFKELDQKSELVNVILRKEKEKTIINNNTTLWQKGRINLTNATALEYLKRRKYKEI